MDTVVAVGLALIATVLYIQLPSGWLRQGVVHVSPQGFDGFVGHSPRFAVRTIQRAAQIAEPGETILIWPGVYRENVRLQRGGRPGQPLVLRAAVPGRAVISGAADPGVMRSWRWRAEGPRLWSTAVNWRVPGLRWNSVTAYHSRSPRHLRRICARPGAWPAYAMKGRRLWLCLPGGQRPRLGDLEVRRPMRERTRAGGHQVASVWIEAPYVEVRDLRFDFVVTAGIQLWNTHHVRIEGNQFDGADVAINDNASLLAPHAISISHNFSTCYPLYEWGRHGWLSWHELYSYSNCSLVLLRGGDIQVANNIISQAGDGIKLSPESGSSLARRNLIVETTDDAFELDGLARHLRIENNLVINPFVGLSISPVREGPLLIRGNHFLLSPRDPRIGYGMLLKLMSGPSRGVTLEDNVYVGYSIGHGMADSPISATHVRGNRFALRTPRNHGLAQAGQIHWQENRYQSLTDPEWRQVLWNPAVLQTIGAQPQPLGPIGPAWMRLKTDPAAKPLRPYWDSPWLVGS
jgi:hypothetical protein